MRYQRSHTNFRQYKPKKGFLNFFKKNKRRIVTQRAEPLYHNPFKRTEKKTKKISFKKIILPALLAIWFGIVIYLPYFRITKITYQGLKIIKPGEIENIINQQFLQKRKIWPTNNYFLTRESTIAKTLQEAFLLNSVEVKKIFPSTLAVTLQEKISSAIYDDGHRYFLLDQNGTIIKYLESSTSSEFALTQNQNNTAIQNKPVAISVATTALSTTTTTTSPAFVHIPRYAALEKSYGRYPIIYNINNNAVDEKAAVLPGTITRGIIELFNRLERGRLATMHYATINDPAAGVTVITNKPWKLLIQPTNDITAQLENAKIILRDNKPTEYIDLRFGERVFWK